MQISDFRAWNTRRRPRSFLCGSRKERNPQKILLPGKKYRERNRRRRPGPDREKMNTASRGFTGRGGGFLGGRVHGEGRMAVG
jgi:hypothetical protein